MSVGDWLLGFGLIVLILFNVVVFAVCCIVAWVLITHLGWFTGWIEYFVSFVVGCVFFGIIGSILS